MARPTATSRIRDALRYGSPAIRSRTLRIAVSAGAVMVIALLLLRLAAPYFVSLPVFRAALESAVSEWVGHRVVIEGKAELDFWPRQTILLHSVSVYRDDRADEAPIAQADVVSANIGLFAMFSGEPSLQKFVLVRPQITLTRAADGSFGWNNSGLIGRAVAQMAANPRLDVLPADLDVTVGDFRIIDASVSVQSASGAFQTLSHLDARVAWPRLSKPLTMTGTAKQDDGPLQFDLTSNAPLLLLAGRNAGVTLALKTDAFASHFEGVANLADNSYMAGQLIFTTEDFRAVAARWLQPGTTADFASHAELTASVTTGDNAVKFDNLEAVIGATRASGVVDLQMDGDARPKLSGTVAFNAFDAKAFLKVFMPQSLALEQGKAGLVGAPPVPFDLDLRLSADAASFDRFALQNVAASVMTSQDDADVTIGSSEFLSGTLSGHVKLGRKARSDAQSLQLAIMDADIGALSDVLAIPAPAPSGTGLIDLNLSSDSALADLQWQSLHGSIAMTINNGKLAGLDAGKFQTLAEEKKSFALSAATGDDYTFASLSLTAALENGIADISNITVVGDGQRLQLSGIMPYPNLQLALAGAMKVAGDDAMVLPDLHFLVGGIWPEVVISPVGFIVGTTVN